MRAEIIRLLHERGDFVSSQELCAKFGVSRTAVWKEINKLKEEGYEIESVSRKGYRLAAAPDLLTAEEIGSALSRLLAQAGREGETLAYGIGSRIVAFDEIDSTNNYDIHAAEEGQASGLLAVADTQTAGKGRRGRSWTSPAGTSISMSLMLKPDIAPNHASMLTLVAALATAGAIREAIQAAGYKVTKALPKIKWPNDIVMDGKKIVGILTEASIQMDYVSHLVIGIGINVHTDSFPEEISAHAGSIYTVTGIHIRRAELVARFLLQFEKFYAKFLETEDLSGLMEEYNAILANMDRQVRVLDPKEPFEGTARGISNTGELLVEIDGRIKEVASGEVSVRGLYGYV